MEMKNDKWYRDKYMEMSSGNNKEKYQAEDFEECMVSVFRFEGGYVNDPKDQGGETKYGISKRAYPNINIKNLSKHTALCIYFMDYWVANHIYELNYKIRNKFLHMSILSGNTKAVKLLQRSAKAYNVNLDEDGIIGEKTLKFGSCFYTGHLYVLKSEWANELRNLNNPRFIEGWLNRAYA